MGTVLQAGQGQIPSRQAQIEGGIPKEVSSETINKVCASGIRAVGMLDQAIRAGDVEVGVGGGMESMSNAPVHAARARASASAWATRKAIDAMIHDGLTNPFTGKHMAQEASEVAAEFELTRADMDQLGAALARAHDRRHRRGPPARGDRPGHGQGPQGRHGRRGRRVAAPRLVAGDAVQAAADLHEGRHRTPPATPRASTTAAARWSLASDEWAEANGKEVLAEIVAQAQMADDFPYLGTHARARPR